MVLHNAEHDFIAGLNTRTKIGSGNQIDRLCATLGVDDFILMRRYARVDPPELGGEGDEFALPAVEY